MQTTAPSPDPVYTLDGEPVDIAELFRVNLEADPGFTDDAAEILALQPGQFIAFGGQGCTIVARVS
jgi:hypothetical protein